VIREAGLDDIPAIVELGGRQAALARICIGYDPASVAAMLENLIASPDGILLFDGTGMIGGICYPHPFNLSVKVGQEAFWYSEGGTGLALLDACEAKAKENGVRFWTMLAEETMRPKAVGRILERRGYRPLEHSYIKEL
jgi:hypothetical protein